MKVSEPRRDSGEVGKEAHRSSSISLSVSHRKKGYVPFSHEGTNTIGHSSPLAAWHVERVTFYTSLEEGQRSVAGGKGKKKEGGRTSAFLSFFASCVSVSVASIEVARKTSSGVVRPSAAA